MSTDKETQQQTGGNSVAPKNVQLTYNADSQIATISHYADLAGTHLVATSTYGYDGDGRLTSLAHAVGTTTLNSYTRGYHNASRVTTASSNDGTDSFGYDPAGRRDTVRPTEAKRGQVGQVHY